MKNIFFGALFLIASSTALACPNLTGDWVCGPSDTPTYYSLKSMNMQGEKYLLINTQIGNERISRTFSIGDSPRQSSCSQYSVEIKNGGNHTIYTRASASNMVVTSIGRDTKVNVCTKM